ncbi:uncharacterized protein LOC113292860 [Papaver somniferum]|uniref:uncharacterized protein LOC113292860 n=1 Tax=Papaver somniferum TaxID=3469 RepID=UPI000E6F4B55|nr:uncharacterized protein LOC113292860 [Papaver somniferum]
MADGRGGTIIDSGTPFTTMLMPHLERVIQLFVDYFHPFGIHPVVAPPESPLDTCWVIPANFNNFPTMTYHFQDADFVIQQMSGIFVYMGDQNMICLGIIGEEDNIAPYDVILGAMQQANKRIMYDIDHQHLSV